jgi:hypothetical protein
MIGWYKLGKFGYGLLDSTTNALKDSPAEFRFLLSSILATMWCISFGIYTAELLFIGYNIIGHVLLITCVFITWGLFRLMKSNQAKVIPNKVRWDLSHEG